MDDLQLLDLVTSSFKTLHFDNLLDLSAMRRSRDMHDHINRLRD
jgi:hypothetical protein